jgi:hypothetical protein
MRRVRLVCIIALKFVHVLCRRLLSPLCAVIARGAERRVCLVARCAAGRVPRWLGCSWPQRGVDPPLWPAAATALPWPFALCAPLGRCRGSRPA